MEVKTGVVIEFGGEKFQIIDIQRNDTLEGKMLYIRACDPDTADREQQTRMKVGQTTEGVVDLLKNIVDKGKRGGFDMGDFGGR